MEMPLPEIVLIGTIHLYSESYPLLIERLESLRPRPRVVTVEISRFSIEFRKKYEKRWRDRLYNFLNSQKSLMSPSIDLKLLERQIKMPYEWEACNAFCARHSIRIIPVDIGTLSKKELPLWEHELLSEQNLKLLSKSSSTMTLKDHFRVIRDKANAIINGKGDFNLLHHHYMDWLSDPFWAKRERALARRIERIAKVTMPVCHVCGWMHLIKGRPWKTLHDQLLEEGLSPMVFTAF